MSGSGENPAIQTSVGARLSAVAKESFGAQSPVEIAAETETHIRLNNVPGYPNLEMRVERHEGTSLQMIHLLGVDCESDAAHGYKLWLDRLSHVPSIVSARPYGSSFLIIANNPSEDMYATIVKTWTTAIGFLPTPSASPAAPDATA